MSSYLPELVAIIVIIWFYLQCKKKNQLPNETTKTLTSESIGTDLTQLSGGSSKDPSSASTAMSPIHHTPFSITSSSSVQTGRLESVADTRKRFESTSSDGQSSNNSDPSKNNSISPYQTTKRSQSPNPRAIKPASHAT